jgi:hypothetical protein
MTLCSLVGGYGHLTEHIQFILMVELPMRLHESNEPEDWSWDRSVSRVMGYRLNGQVRFLARATFFSSPQCSDWLWGPPSLSNGYQGGKVAGA